MAHWFHRNPLKATAMVTFDLGPVSSTTATSKITSDLRMSRNKLLDIVKDPNLEVETLETGIQQYFSLLLGLIEPPKGVHETSGDSKLRYAITFRWNDSLQAYDQEPTNCDDALFEALNMCINIALWYTKHAAKIAGAKDEPSMDEAKEVHKCLRKAAGIFKYCKDNVGRLLQVGKKNSDLDTRVLSGYMHMCTAEAQEITIARAVTLKHAPSLISAISHETSNIFQQADKALESLDQELCAKWRKYLQLKAHFYKSYSYCYQGDALLAADKGGEAIASLKECKKIYEETQTICKDYHSTKGQGTTAKPQEHPFYMRFYPVVARTLEKTERENGFIYHQKVPDKPNELELKATYGLVSPEEFAVPDMSEQWTQVNYGAFDLSLRKIDPKEKKRKEKEESGPLPPVKEAEIPQSMKQSVCAVM